MPRKDVNVTIDIQKASKLTGLGKPVILAKFSTTPTYVSYSDLAKIESDFGTGTAVYNIAKTILNQGDSSPKEIAIATYNEEVSAAEVIRQFLFEDWYFVTADTQVVAEIKAIADVVETQDVKQYATTVSTIADLTLLHAQKYKQTFVAVHKTVEEYVAEGLVGAVGSKEPGSVTYKFKTINGITPQDFTDEEITAIHALNGFVYITKSGVPQTSDGKTIFGEWIDVIHAKGWVVVNVEEAIQSVFSTNDKVPYTNAGINLLALTIEDKMIQATTMGMLVAEDGYTITTKSRDEVEPIDRETRIYKGLSFTFELSGAIHEANITASIKL